MSIVKEMGKLALLKTLFSSEIYIAFNTTKQRPKKFNHVMITAYTNCSELNQYIKKYDVIVLYQTMGSKNR